jgi:predicted transcriptional regulator
LINLSGQHATCRGGTARVLVLADDEKEPWVNIVAINLVFELELKLSPGETLVLLCLASHADRDGVCYPAIGTIAGEINISKVAVQQALERLADKELIQRDRYVPEKGKRRGHSGYKLSGEWISNLSNRMDKLLSGMDKQLIPNKKEYRKEHYAKESEGPIPIRNGSAPLRNGPEDPHAGLPESYVKKLRRSQ